MSATILRMPRRRARRATGTLLVNLGELTRAARQECQDRKHAAEMTVLLIYVKCDPPAHQLAAELGITAAEAARRLKAAGHLIRHDEAFRDAFHAINSRLD